MENLVARCLDHKPILTSCYSRNYAQVKRGKRFKFKASWNLEAESHTQVEQLWNNVSIKVILLTDFRTSSQNVELVLKGGVPQPKET